MRMIERILLDLAGLAMAMLCLLMIADATLSAATGAGVPAVSGLAKAIAVAVIALPLAAATAGRAHLAVNLVSDRIGRMERARLILLGHTVGIVALVPVIGAVTWPLLQGRDSGIWQFGGAGLVLLAVGLTAMWVRLGFAFAADLREFRATGTITDEHGHEAI